MDPEANLKELRELCGADPIDSDDAERIAELFRALDGWMSNGGFTPESWDYGERSKTR